MDDGRYLVSALGPGYRYCKSTKTIRLILPATQQEYEDDDKDRTLREMLNMFNDVSDDLSFTCEHETDFSDQKLPTLDVKIWLDEIQRVRYTFYEKPMGSKLCIQKDTALPEQLKKSVLVAEVRMRLQNIDQYSETDEIVNVLNEYDEKMTRSGYKRKERLRVVSDGYIGYRRKIERCIRNGTPTHRDGGQGIHARRVRKMMASKNWYKKKKQEEENVNKNEVHKRRGYGDKTPTNDRGQVGPIAVYFVPRTPGGVLASMVRKSEQRMENVFTRRVKISERPGTKLEEVLTKSNPWGDRDCGRKKCNVCGQEDEGK